MLEKFKTVTVMGGVTLQIYVLHGYFILDYVHNKWIDSIASFVIGVSFSWIAAYFISKSKYLDYILFGNKIREKINENRN